HEHPVPVYRGVPVEAAIEGWVHGTGRLNILFAVEHIARLVGILLADAFERELGEGGGVFPGECDHRTWLAGLLLCGWRPRCNATTNDDSTNRAACVSHGVVPVLRSGRSVWRCRF